jgi:signal-transduction protein with cAMP-binding, CBS, and nucleotidyltransferase domain
MDVDARSAVRALMTADPVSVDEKLSLRSLAAVLAGDEIGVVLVRCRDGSLGILSERDIVRALADGADPDTVWAVDVMSEELVTVGADDVVIDVALRLVAENLRHVAVTEHGDIVGVVSARDVFPIVTNDLLDSWS